MWLSLTIYRLLTPLGYKQTAVNTPPTPPKWRRSTYYFIYISIYPKGKQFPVGAGWGGGLLLLLLLFLNNFCYSCIENLKGKVGGEEKKPSAATFNQAITAAGCAQDSTATPGHGAAPHRAGTRHGCTTRPSPEPPKSRGASPSQQRGKASLNLPGLSSAHSNPVVWLS